MPGNSSWMPYAPQGVKEFDDDDDDDDDLDAEFKYVSRISLSPTPIALHQTM